MLALGTDTLGDVQPSPELERAGEYVKARMRQLRLSREDATRQVRLARETWRKIERGMRVSDESYYKAERALRWPEGTMRHIIDGGEPPAGDSDEAPAGRPLNVYDRRDDLNALLQTLGEADEQSQRLMIETALAAYRASQRNQSQD